MPWAQKFPQVVIEVPSKRASAPFVADGPVEFLAHFKDSQGLHATNVAIDFCSSSRTSKCGGVSKAAKRILSDLRSPKSPQQ
jgi:hypothetical protein